MGYDVHITRKGEWWDEDGPAITLDEWLAVVDADPDLRHDGFSEARSPDGDVLRIEYPGLSVWTAHPDGNPDVTDGGQAWISHRDGDVVVKNPDPAFLAKMIDIAAALDAHVQGEEGEPYDANNLPSGDATQHPPAPEAVAQPPRKKRWFGKS